ncbi:polysaccharide biosynthesis/export family protein [Mucilaginibacter endophyticus]|uniref:polysaccharide biosynthesis/export family protein n=1 Tax=Mucilaginibacter endophyticus TaxID=2675003 RepID=UPI000E0DF6B9|nr:polysaccharide biosynthesis/export family protein [Mucilaginibacter endophyticus]
MRKSYIVNSFLLLFILFISAGLLSCSSTKKVKYFQDIPDSGQLKLIPAAVYVQPKIQVDDILSIIVQTIDPIASQNVNGGNVATGTAPLGSLAGGSSGQSALGLPQASSGYLVDKDGNIDMSILGRIHVVGYSTSELKEVITKEASKYYNNPTVSVRFANFKVSIAGEVLKPGQYVIPNEKVSVLDAIAMAGDLTIFAKRENVLLIRENPDGTKTPYRINLKKSDIMSSSYYYLKQNDYIYVEPRKAKSDATDAAQAKYVTIAGALLSLLIVIATRAK